MFAPAAPHRCARRTMLRGGSERSRRFRRNASTTQEEISSWVEKARVSRLQHLEEQASTTIRKAVEAASGEPIAFPCALIAGDVIMLDKEPNPNLKPIHLLLTEKGMVLHHFPVQLCKHRSKMNNDYINTNSRRTRPGSGLP